MQIKPHEANKAQFGEVQKGSLLKLSPEHLK